MAVSGMACLQSERPVAMLYPFEHPTRYDYAWQDYFARFKWPFIVTNSDSVEMSKKKFRWKLPGAHGSWGICGV
jgi:hypothetical protein